MSGDTGWLYQVVRKLDQTQLQSQRDHLALRSSMSHVRQWSLPSDPDSYRPDWNGLPFPSITAGIRPRYGRQGKAQALLDSFSPPHAIKQSQGNDR